MNDTSKVIPVKQRMQIPSSKCPSERSDVRGFLSKVCQYEAGVSLVRLFIPGD